MAKYTELFYEYIEQGGTLPVQFDNIPTFKDLFILHYCDKEIGFETPTLFKLKLDEIAMVKIPLYEERIKQVNNYKEQILDPKKLHVESVSYGEQNASSTDLPINSDGAIPSTKNNVQAHSDTRNITDSGITNDELIRMYDWLHAKVQSILNELLEEFRSCFMEIY